MKIWNARVATFSHLIFTHVPREKNRRADWLANKAMNDKEKKPPAKLF